jgi:hypothetical protein
MKLPAAARVGASGREPYRDLGDTYFDHLDRQHVEHRLVRRLERLGYSVTLAPVTPGPEAAA